MLPVLVLGLIHAATTVLVSLSLMSPKLATATGASLTASGRPARSTLFRRDSAAATDPAWATFMRAL
jgi:hypothetical protein